MHNEAEIASKIQKFFNNAFCELEAMMCIILMTGLLVLCLCFLDPVGLATAAGAQLAASCDLIVSSTDSAFETPG